jgi:hypothetical protein
MIIDSTTSSSYLCPTKRWAIAWIHDFLELVCREEKGRPRQGQACILVRGKISCNLAKMEET